MRQRLEIEPGLQAKTLFEHLQHSEPGRFTDGQLRTLQRRIKQWRATEGPAKEKWSPFSSAVYTAQFAGLLLAHHHGQSVPANRSGDPPLQFQIARIRWLL